MKSITKLTFVIVGLITSMFVLTLPIAAQLPDIEAKAIQTVDLETIG